MRRDERWWGPWLRWAELVERMCFRVADAIFVTSAGDKRYLEETYRIPGAKIEVMPNVVDTALFAPGRPAHRDPGAVRLISIGRFVEMKNFQGLIRAAAGLDGRVEVVLIGDGPYRSELVRIARETGVPVTFRPWMDNSALPPELQAADIFVMPQLYGSGMSKVLLEAMACGTLTIASDIRPHREVIEDGVNGLLCGVEAESIRASLRRALSMRPEERTRMTARARGEVVERYSMQALAAREAAFYRSRRVGIS
jgi:glycosyltransferase involved in cell wall biosynthesis